MINLQKKINKISGNLKLENEIKSGPISKIFSCEFNNIKAIVRFDLPLASKLNLNRRREVTILNKISFLNQSPKILFENISEGILIWEYILGAQLNVSQNDKVLLTDLSRSLKKIHEIKLPKNIVRNFNESIIFYKTLLIDSPNQKLINKGLNLFEEINDEDAPRVFSHNDLNKTNLLLGSKIYFLDWEYASMNSPYFDIASLAATFNLDNAGINILLEGYSDNFIAINQEKLKKWISFTYYLDYLWRISIVKLDDSYNKTMKLDEFESFLLNL